MSCVPSPLRGRAGEGDERSRASPPHPPALREGACRGKQRHPPHVHDVVGRAHRRRAVPGQGRDPVRARRAAWSAWRRPGARPASTGLIGFDMGGTSTDVSHFDGEYERAFETEVAGVRMRAPMMLIHTVAAGGGSILHFDGARFRVGPDSRRRQSRAEVLPPRRAARRHRRQRDGRQADPGFLPEDLRAAARTSRSTPRRCARRSPSSPREIGDGRTPEEVADGFIRIAVENMANAIKKISVQRGYDVTRYALNCFGGAGGQHACLVADALGMTTVLIHPFSSLLSAYGMGLADIRATRQQAIEEPFGETRARVHRRRRRPARRGGARRGGRPGRARARRRSVHVRAHIRYAGTDTALVVAGVHPLGIATMGAATQQTPQSAFARRDEVRVRGRAQVALRLHRRDQGARGRGGVGRGGRRRREVRRAGAARRPRSPLPAPAQRTRFFSGGAWHDAAVFTRDQLAPGHQVAGPAIIIEPHQTIVVEDGWQAEITREEPPRADARRAAARGKARSAPRPIR